MEKTPEDILESINKLISGVTSNGESYPASVVVSDEMLIHLLIKDGWSLEDATLYVDNIPED